MDNTRCCYCHPISTFEALLMQLIDIQRSMIRISSPWNIDSRFTINLKLKILEDSRKFAQLLDSNKKLITSTEYILLTVLNMQVYQFLIPQTLHIPLFERKSSNIPNSESI